MKAVPITELKARLSHYVQWVKRGGEVQILERGVPVARLVGVGRSAPTKDKRRERLARAGVLRTGTGDASWILEEKPFRLKAADVSQALQEDRADRA